MQLKNTLIFLHATIKNISHLVLGLSLLSLLPRPIIAILTLNQLLSPAAITILTISYSAYLAHTSEQETKPFNYPGKQLIKKISNFLKKNIVPDLYFGICKGLQSLTVISYIRASLHLPKTIITPSISFVIGSVSATLSSYSKEKSKSHSFHLSKNAIDFFLNTITSCGFLYLLNTTSALSVTSLSVLFFCLISLSIFVESENIKNTLSVSKHNSNQQHPSSAILFSLKSVHTCLKTPSSSRHKHRNKHSNLGYKR